jgi:hypothetical protein
LARARDRISEQTSWLREELRHCVSEVWQSFLFGLFGVGLSATLAFHQYLDNKRRESAERRYIDGCLDPLTQAIATSAARQHGQLASATIWLKRARDQPLTVESQAEARTEFSGARPEPQLDGKYYRLAGLVDDEDIFTAVTKALALIDKVPSWVGPDFPAFLVRFHRYKSKDKDRLIEAYELFTLSMGSVLSSMPHALARIAVKFSDDIYSEATFDLPEARRRLATSLHEPRELLVKMTAELTDAEDKANRALAAME